MYIDAVYIEIRKLPTKKWEFFSALINTGFLLGNTWQHPKSPQNEVLNIAETPENAASAFPEASLGEDKY
ncbi:MAG: hypothetical protein K2O16_07250 [Lachnospiraceae bacterium]|nr:hypothetical protein [Lachnospiraceae bacterium]